MKTLDYGKYFGGLLKQKGLKNPTVTGAGDEILDTIYLMLKEKDSRYVRDIAEEFSPFLRWETPFICDRMSALIRKRGEEKKIHIISLEDTLIKVYNQPIYQVKRPDPSKGTKRFKDSQIAYLDEQVLIKDIKENTYVELAVFIK